MADQKNDGGAGVDKEELRKRFAKLGEARRVARGVKPTAHSKEIGERISKLAGERGMVVEWTLRPQETSETAGVACGCGCGCGCSCIA